MSEEKSYGEMSREEIVTGKPPLEAQPAEDKDSREYHAKHGWPEEAEPTDTGG